VSITAGEESSESAAVRAWGDACIEKTAGMWGRPLRAVFYGMCVGEHRASSDSERLSLLLSLASEKEEGKSLLKLRHNEAKDVCFLTIENST
jgi:hypothetical protein